MRRSGRRSVPTDTDVGAAHRETTTTRGAADIADDDDDDDDAVVGRSSCVDTTTLPPFALFFRPWSAAVGTRLYLVAATFLISLFYLLSPPSIFDTKRVAIRL